MRSRDPFAPFVPRWREFWKRPDDLLVDAGASGEIVVARIRLFVTAVLLVITVGEVFFGGASAEASAGTLNGLIAVGLALVIYVVVRGSLYRPWLGFATSIADVSLVSGVLVTFLALGLPHTAVNSKVIFPVYFLAISASALRYDARTCAVAGLVATVEYLAVVTWAATHFALNAPTYAPFVNGTFSWSAQVGRLALLLSAGLISTILVLRSQHLRWLSASDPLTQLMNRGFFDERIADEVIRTKRYRRSLSVAMADLDHFKQFNDTYGHACGDEALRVVARAIRRSVRRTDLVARYGGEEFVIAFPETSLEGARQKAEDIRRAVQLATVQLRGGRPPARVTVSLGVAELPHDGDDIHPVLEAADRRLYRAKQAGRNRVFGPTSEETSASVA